MEILFIKNINAFFIHTLDDNLKIIHPRVCFKIYWYNIYFVVKFLGFTCMCIGEKTFYYPKFEL
jgi:hypothetical protein